MPFPAYTRRGRPAALPKPRGFGACTGGVDLLEELPEQGFAVHDAVQRLRTPQQVGVAQVK